MRRYHQPTRCWRNISADYVDEIVDGWIAQAEATEECIAALRDLLPDAAEEDEL